MRRTSEAKRKRIIRFVIINDSSTREAAKIFRVAHSTILRILYNCYKYYPHLVDEVVELLERHKTAEYTFRWRNGI